MNHPNYQFIEGPDEVSVVNDIAVIRVSEPFDFSASNVGRVAIPMPGYGPAPGSMCTFTGWGLTEPVDYSVFYHVAEDLLRKVEMPVIADDGKIESSFIILSFYHS